MKFYPRPIRLLAMRVAAVVVFADADSEPIRKIGVAHRTNQHAEIRTTTPWARASAQHGLIIDMWDLAISLRYGDPLT